MDEDLLRTLLDLDRELAGGDGDTYRSVLLPEAVVIVPGARMGREDTAAAIDAGPGWDRFTLTEPELATVGDCAVLTYIFEGSRGEGETYRAIMASTYVRRDDAWRLAFHQHTPVSPA
jgi:ketosteroid isomerase-like protein